MYLCRNGAISAAAAVLLWGLTEHNFGVWGSRLRVLISVANSGNRATNSASLSQYVEQVNTGGVLREGEHSI